jgi:hypothetical protein
MIARHPHPRPFSRLREKGVWFFYTCGSRLLSFSYLREMVVAKLTDEGFR